LGRYKKKCPEILKFVIFANVAILMMHFTSISNVKEIVLLERKKCSPEFDFEILPEIEVLFLF